MFIRNVTAGNKLQPIIYAALTALLFGSWPILTRFCPLPAAWLAIFISLGTFLTAVICSLFSGTTDVQISPKVLLIALTLGAMNGLGMFIYSKLFGMKEVEISKLVTTVGVLMPVFAVVGALIILGEPLTVKKIIGVVVALIAVYLLNF